MRVSCLSKGSELNDVLMCVCVCVCVCVQVGPRGGVDEAAHRVAMWFCMNTQTRTHTDTHPRLSPTTAGSWASSDWRICSRGSKTDWLGGADNLRHTYMLTHKHTHHTHTPERIVDHLPEVAAVVVIAAVTGRVQKGGVIVQVRRGRVVCRKLTGAPV